ncbi:MAG: DUF4170 domain-containing protein [Rhodospirillaceae bacterium]|nr:DUF4170 domain-containing protein [Rhodospirillaceae bacterium]
MARYWVIGGEYTDTGFTDIVGGKAEERHGPYDDLEAARVRWQQLAWATVDNAHARYRIEQEREAEAPARYWVVGGRYTDTRFSTPAEGEEIWHGPFESHDDAKAAWGRLAWQSVDDALSRWRIERLVGDPPAAASGKAS